MIPINEMIKPKTCVLVSYKKLTCVFFYQMTLFLTSYHDHDGDEQFLYMLLLFDLIFRDRPVMG